MKVVVNRKGKGIGLPLALQIKYLNLQGGAYWIYRKIGFDKWAISNQEELEDHPAERFELVIDALGLETHDDKIRCSLFNRYPPPRTDVHLIAVIESLKGNSTNHVCLLDVVEIPDGIRWQIGIVDGTEVIQEIGRTW